MRALVVDDSSTMRAILTRSLNALRFDQVTPACHGREALDLVAAGETFDCMLVDWNMPVMSGIEFVTAVRSEPFSSTAAIIMVTTESEIEGVTAALRAGADEYLMKPFNVESLADKLRLLGFDV